MIYEVVVVGGGIGGLTVAALLAARGMNVCLLERQSRAGGCVATHEKLGYEFEPTASLYASWQPGEIHDRVFAELPVSPPEVHAVSPAYEVRLPDETNIRITENDEEFTEQLHIAFPECAKAAISFYKESRIIGDALLRTVQRVPDLLTASKAQRARLIAFEARAAVRILQAMNHTAAQHLAQTSLRFRRFVDAQLQMFAQCSSTECAYPYAAVALTIPRTGMYAIRGGAQTLADILIEAIKKSGGTVRLNATALRMACDQNGRAVGVDLLSGERITATRAVISNLTVQDTYAKLVGASHTPLDVHARLKKLRGWSAYLLFLSMDETAAQRLSNERVLALTEWQKEQEKYDPSGAQFMFAASPAWDARAPEGFRAVTVSTFTDPAPWFAFQESGAEREAQDGREIENCWRKIHRAMSELGDSVELIDTLTPLDYYEAMRRRLGMVGGVGQSMDVFGSRAFSHLTVIPNLYIVGDSVFPGTGIAAVTQSALIVADSLTTPASR